MDEEDEHSPNEFYYPEDLETFEVETETGIPGCHIINNLLTELARAVLGNIGELKHATFLSHGRQPEVNILQARTSVSPRFSK